MSTDIYLSVQLRAVSGYARNDGVVQQLVRELETEPERWPELEGIEIRQGPWETVAIEESSIPREPGWRRAFLPRPGREGDPSAGPWLATTLAEVPEPWFYGQDYATFARLADVQNRERVVPISAPRGLPDGWSCPSFSPEAPPGENKYMGNHSHSWLLASEVLAYEGWGKLGVRADVTWDDWSEWAAAGFAGSPRDCGHTHIDGTRLSVQQALAMRARGDRPSEPTFVRCAWEEPMEPTEWMMVEMAKAWAKRFGAENVRFVFGFA
ncbi:MAG: hypothetical protein R3F62_02105 [Planctomycetota bacterium]